MVKAFFDELNAATTVTGGGAIPDPAVPPGDPAGPLRTWITANDRLQRLEARHTALTKRTSPLWATYFPSGAIPVNGVKDINGQACGRRA